MCGIAGIVVRPGGTPDGARLARMADRIGHRGPDGRGEFSAPGVAIAHRRLSIIDLEHGAQPMTSADGVTIAVNGEIYNYRELTRDLGAGEFATASDSEALLHLYRREGIEGVRRARGMFAFVIVDRRGGDTEPPRVYIGRDPFGIKPLYLRRDEGGIWFASEAQALVEAAAPALVERHVREFLALQFTCGRTTVFQGIERVLPGEVLDVSDGGCTPVFRMPALPAGVPRRRFPGLEALDGLLADSVEVHQRSDVPYGLFLSGGIDSTVVMALMARLNARPVVALTSGFPGSGVADERGEARRTAEHFGAVHHEITIEENEFWSLLPQVVAALDDPVGDFATLPTFKMAARARELGIKVILCGEGGDELFAGYGRYRRARYRLTWRGGRRFRSRSKGDFPGLWREPDTGWRAAIAAALAAARGAGLSPLQQAQFTDTVDWLPNDLLTKLDRCLMAHGVEGRTPFLDPEVAAFAFPLRDRDKMRRGLGKYPLRQWLERHVPHARPFAKKNFFSVPVAEWIMARGAEVGPLVAAQPCVAALCVPDRVAALFATPGKRTGFTAWLLLFYALWHRIHVEGVMPEAGVTAQEILAAPP